MRSTRRATTDVGTFFGNTNPATTVNGFQTTCASCNIVGAPAVLPDATIFALTSAASATFSAQILAQTTTLAKGSTEQLTVLGTYSDGTFQDLTSKVTWLSSNPSAATISSSGLVSAVGAGMTTTISATLAGTTIPEHNDNGSSRDGLAVQCGSGRNAYGTVTDNLGQINCTNIAGQGTTGTCNTTYPSGNASDTDAGRESRMCLRRGVQRLAMRRARAPRQPARSRWTSRKRLRQRSIMAREISR